MTADNDVNSLFEKHSIKEIEDLLRKTRNDIEKKKEDLRVMVGERYRDLIEAADTISDMRVSAQAVCENIQTMEGLCESLQQRGLIGFKTRMSSSNHDGLKLAETGYQYTIAVQVKLLVDVPEILWGLTEKKEFLSAAQLLLLSQHAHTALQLSPNANEMLQWFPVISRQWSNISHFKTVITKGCVNLIKSEVVNYQAVLEALVAIMFIEGCSIQDSFAKVLVLRKSILDSVLVVRPSVVAKTQLIQFITFFMSSFCIIQYIFSGSDKRKCNLVRKIEEVTADEINPEDGVELPISFLQESSLGLNFLPKSVLEFRPKLRNTCETLGEKFIKEEVGEWLKSIISEASESIKHLLSFTTSIKALSIMRSSIWEAQENKIEEEQWNKVVLQLLGKGNFSPWQSVVKYQALERVKFLIGKELVSTKNSILNLVQDLCNEVINNSRTCMEEGDITNFVWSESSSDLPDQVGWTSTAARNTIGTGERSGLFYKSRGYTKRIQAICKSLNMRLSALLEDVSHYAPASLKVNSGLTFSNGSSSSKENDSASLDYSDILHYLEHETVQTFKEFLKDLDKIVDDYSKLEDSTLDDLWEDSNTQISSQSTIIVMISRLCHAIPIVSPQIKVCTGASLLGNQDTARRMTLGVQPDTNSWLELQKDFSHKSTHLMTKYLTLLTHSLYIHLKQEFSELLENESAESLLLLYPTWESVPIEEEGENGQVIHSSILIPVHPSPILTQYLKKICSSVNCVCAHTITRTSQLELVNQLCYQLATLYETLESTLQNVNQTTSLQLIFDLKLVQAILLPRESKELVNRFSSLIHKLESRVDPFDLDVFHPHLSSRVKVAAVRLQVLLGTILPRDRQHINIRGISSMMTSANNTLPIIPSVEIPRFSNVPLPVNFSRNKSLATEAAVNLLLNDSLRTPMKNTTDSSTSSQPSRDTTSSTGLSASRSAASLFSAMSSSWFGGASS